MTTVQFLSSTLIITICNAFNRCALIKTLILVFEGIEREIAIIITDYDFRKDLDNIR